MAYRGNCVPVSTSIEELLLVDSAETIETKKRERFVINENMNGRDMRSAIVIHLFQIQFGREKGDVMAPKVVTFESLQF